jgi:Mg-chelatase subunit ChlD
MEDALKIAQVIAQSQMPCMVVDVSRTPNPKARTLSENLNANYIPMPFVSSKNLSDAVKARR